MPDQWTPARLVLHIGVQKTATTAMQQFLQANARALRPFLTVYTPRKGSPAQHLGRKAIDYTLAPSDQTEADFVAAIEAMKQVLDRVTGTVLISHENLVGAPPGSFGQPRLYPFIDRIVGLLDRHFAPYRPEYAYYTREMPAWKRSVHNQIVKTDGYLGDWDEYAALVAPITGWDAFHDRLCAAAGADRVTRFRLEDQIDARRPGLQLLRHLGVPEKRLERLDPINGLRNESLNAGALEFMRRANAAGFAPHILTRLGSLVASSQPLFSPTVAVTRD